MFNQMKDLYKLKRQADDLKKKMQTITLEVEVKNVKVVMRGDNNVEAVFINGEENPDVKRAINKATKEVQKKVAKKFQGQISGMNIPGM